MTGPLTVGEAASHLGRAQSVVSEIVDGLERRALVERERDPVDGRRTPGLARRRRAREDPDQHHV